MRTVTTYLPSLFNPSTYSSTLKTAEKSIKRWERNNAFDTIAFTGISGAGVAFPLANRLFKGLICVRKELNSCHSKHKVEGQIGAKHYIIVDDFVETGNTIFTIVKEINLAYEKYCHPRTFGPPICVGVYLYDTNSWNKPEYPLIPRLE